MELKGRNYLLSKINPRVLKLKRKGYHLFPFHHKTWYSIDEIYGVFLSDRTFTFVKEGSVPFDIWEEMTDAPFPYSELVHKRQYQLFDLESSQYMTEPYLEDAPWHLGEEVLINGVSAIPIEGDKIIPSHMKRLGRIDEDSLLKIESTVRLVIKEDPSFMETCCFNGKEMKKAI